MRTGLTAGGGMLLGLIVGTIFFGNPALGIGLRDAVWRDRRGEAATVQCPTVKLTHYR